MQRTFITYCILFFIPVALGYLTVEYFTRQIPSSFQINKERLEKDSDQIETLILGSSQLMSGINAEWLFSPTLNLASGNQHHDTDFKLLMGLLPKLPSLKTIVLEVSYSHFELPHNGADFWKNSVYLDYYDINCFERFTYFKDRLIFLSNPSFFAEQLQEFYLDQTMQPKLNLFAFNYADSYGQFNALNYNKEAIDQKDSFKINLIENPALYHTNAALFKELIDTLQNRQLQVIVASPPMYPTYLKKRVPSILKRRNQVLQEIVAQYENVEVLFEEENTSDYELKDFWNQSHLSPSGAKKFTQSLNTLLNSR